jgi:hypothetical protein
LKIQLKGRHFDTVEMIEAESQAVPNTLTEHGFQDTFKKMAGALGTVHKRRRALLQGWWWPVGPKLVFDQMAAPILEIMNMSGNLPTLSTPHISHSYHHHSSSYSKYFYFHSSMLHISHKSEMWGQKRMSRHFLEILQLRFKPHMKQRLQWTDADQTKWIIHFSMYIKLLKYVKSFLIF